MSIHIHVAVLHNCYTEYHRSLFQAFNYGTQKQSSRSYSDLPPDLHYTVFEKLEERDDRLIWLAVCESWKLVIENQYPQLKRYFSITAKPSLPSPPSILLSSMNADSIQQSSSSCHVFNTKLVKRSK